MNVRDPVQLGQRVLILGTGGVATFALQLARAVDAQTIVTSSSDAKLVRMRELGASHLINDANTLKWAQEVLRLTDGVVLITSSGIAMAARWVNRSQQRDVEARFILSVSSRPVHDRPHPHSARQPDRARKRSGVARTIRNPQSRV